MRNDVFVSYSHRDLLIARELVSFLKQLGLKVWFDKESLLAGEEWERVIKNQIKNCVCFLVCLSSKSIDKRGYFHKEIRLAIDIALTIPPNQLYMLPARLDDCRIPDDLSRYHVVNLSDADGVKLLTRSLSKAVRRNLNVSGEIIEAFVNSISKYLNPAIVDAKPIYDTLVKGLSSPKRNIDLIEQLANSNDPNRLNYLHSLASLPDISFAEADAIGLALQDIQSKMRVNSLLYRVSRSELAQSGLNDSRADDDPVYRNVGLLRFWRYVNRKTHPRYSQFEKAISTVLFSGSIPDDVKALLANLTMDKIPDDSST